MSFNLIQRIRNKIRVQKNNHISLGNNLKISGCQVSIKGKNNTLKIADNVRIRDTFIQITGENNLIKIGSGSVIGRGSYISAREKNITLTIGENCSLSRYAKVMTSDGHELYHKGVRINEAKSITIGNGVWLADNTTVLKGVTIGDEATVGINATLTKSIPVRSIAVGNPAKVVKENVSKNQNS